MLACSLRISVAGLGRAGRVMGSSNATTEQQAGCSGGLSRAAVAAD